MMTNLITNLQVMEFGQRYFIESGLTFKVGRAPLTPASNPADPDGLIPFAISCSWGIMAVLVVRRYRVAE